MPNTLQIRRGLQAALPTGLAGELLFATDTKRFYISDGSATNLLQGAATLLTTGAIPFSDANGKLTMSASNLYWDNTNNRLGIGTASPTAKNHIVGAGTTNTTFPFLVTDSAGTLLFRISDLGNITLSSNQASKQARFFISGYTNPALNITSGLTALSTIDGGNLALQGGLIQFYNQAGTTEWGRFFSTGNLLLQTGGTYTDAGYKLDVNGTARVTGDTIIQGSTALSNGRALLVRNTNSLHGLSVTNNAEVYIGRNSLFYINDTSTGGYTFSIAASNSGIAFTNSAGASRPVSFSMNTGEILRIHQSYTAIVTNNFLVGTTTDVASSKLTVESTTQGFLPPRMTTTQKNAIASPASGLVVYDTTLGKLCVRGASAWETITSI